MFLVTFKTEKNLFHLTDPKPVLSQKLVNVTSTKYILQLALNRFAKSPIGYKAFEGKFRNFKRQYFFETFILKWSFVYSSWRMCFVLVTFLMFVTKLVLDPLVETVFAQFLKLSETCWKVMAKIDLLLFISRMFSSNFEKIKLTLTKVKALIF